MKKFIHLISTFLITLSPTIASAANGTPDLEDVNKLVSTATAYVRMIGYGAAVAVIIWAGIAYFTAYGNEEKPKQAKDAIKGAIIGIVLIVLAQTIVLAILGQVKATP